VHDRPRSPDRPGAFDRPGSYDRPSAFERPRSYDRPSTYDRPRSYDRPSAFDRSRSSDRHSGFGRPGSYDRPDEYDLPGQYGLPGAYAEPEPYDRPGAYADRREYTGRGGYAEPDEYDDQDEYGDDPRAYDGQHGYAQDEYDDQDEYDQDEYEYAQDEYDEQDEYGDPRAYDLPASHDRPAAYDHPAAYDDQDDDEQDDGYEEPGQHDRDRPSAYDRLSTGHRRRKARPITSVLQNRPAKVAAAAVAGSALMVAAWPAASHLLNTAHHAGVDQADALGLPGAGPKAAPTVKPRGTHTRPQPEILGISVASRPGKHRKPGQAMPPGGYMNPLRSVSGLAPERIDEGVDFAGTGAVYAIGDGVVTTADGTNGGWPGGGWITYRLTDGPDAGLMVYVAEDVTPTVQVGQHVTPSTVIANMWNGGDGIETGWADSGALSAESQQAAAGGIGGYGPFPTMVGLNFDELLQSLGVPAAPNSGQAASGLLPAGYPSWG
jgi:hypothetical protein